MRALGLLLLAVLLTANAATAQESRSSTAAERGALTPHQYDVAVQAAHDEASAQHAHLTSAWAVAVPNTHPRAPANTGHACRSATVVRVWLLGSFPHITVGGTPGITGAQATVSAMVVRVDAASGEACLIGVRTGPQHPGPAWTRLRS